MMRLIYLTHDDLSVPAAWQTHVREVVLALRARGHHVTLFCPEPAPEWARPAVTYPRSRWNVTLGCLPAMRRAVRGGDAGLLYVRGQHLSVAHFLSGVPFIVEINGLIEDEMHGWRYGLYRLVTMLHTRLARKVVVVTQGLKDALVRRGYAGPRKIHVVSNAANPDVIRPLDRNACRRELGLDPRKKYFVYVSSFYPHHHHLQLVDAVAEVKDLNLILVGDGATRSRVQERIKAMGLSDRVLDVGRVPHDRMALYLGAADVCVMLSMAASGYELAPMKMFETMAAGRPLFMATNNPAMAEFITRHGSGHSFLWRGDTASLADALNRMVVDAVRWKDYGENGRRLIVEEYSWAKMAERLEREVLPSHQR